MVEVITFDSHIPFPGQATQMYGGRMTKNRLDAVKTVTEDALNQLQNLLDKMPDAQVQLTDPRGR